MGRLQTKRRNDAKAAAKKENILAIKKAGHAAGSHADYGSPVKRAFAAEFGRHLTPNGTHFVRGAVGLVMTAMLVSNIHMSETAARRIKKVYLAERQRVGPVLALDAFSSKRGNNQNARKHDKQQINQTIRAKNIETKGRLPLRQLAKKINLPPTTVFRYLDNLGAMMRKRWIKPLLTVEHRMKRICWALHELEGDGAQARFGAQYDTVHVDEAWFWQMSNGAWYRSIPDENGECPVLKSRRTRHKSHIPKVMFLAANARPNADYGFDGKICLLQIQEEKTAQRNSKKRKAGDKYLVNVSVDASIYRRLMAGDGLAKSELMANDKCVFEHVREKMWWFKQGARYKVSNGVRVRATSGGTLCPEAGKTLWIQQDGARPHTAAEAWLATQSKQGGFNLQVTTQPAQSPDLNVNDLGFFRSLKCAAANITEAFDMDEMIGSIRQAWEEMEPDKLDRMFQTLINNYRLALKHDGDNDFTQAELHLGKQKKGYKMDYKLGLGARRLKDLRALADAYQTEENWLETSEFAKKYNPETQQTLLFDDSDEENDYEL